MVVIVQILEVESKWDENSDGRGGGNIGAGIKIVMARLVIMKMLGL